MDVWGEQQANHAKEITSLGLVLTYLTTEAAHTTELRSRMNLPGGRCMRKRNMLC
jgi:hypothetical protein